MGLSDEERIHGIFPNIVKIIRTAREIEPTYPKEPFVELKEACGNLWHDFLGNRQNGAHWILGSSAGNQVGFNTASPWGVAVFFGVEEAKQYKEQDEKDEFDRNVEKINQAFDPKAYTLSIEGLLNSADEKNLARVFTIFALTENLIYYVRRYDDDLLKRLEALSRSISKIQGLCHEIFSSEELACARAYVLAEICDLILVHPYQVIDDEDEKKLDAVCLAVHKMNMHHDMSEAASGRSVVSLKELFNIHKELMALKQEDKLKTPAGLEARLFALLRICNRRFHYEHNHKQLKKILVTRKVKYNAKRLDVLLKEAITLHEKREKESQECYAEQSKWNEKSLYEL